MKLNETRLVVSNGTLYTEITAYDYRGMRKSKRLKGNLLTLEGERILRMEKDKLKEELDRG